VESEAAAAPGYVNRPVGHTPERRTAIAAVRRETGRRPAMRIALVALRAYEQRAERRRRMRAWMVARTAAAGARG
jgi:hypothetical protein